MKSQRVTKRNKPHNLERRFTVRLCPTLVERVRKEAARAGETSSATTRKALAAYVSAQR